MLVWCSQALESEVGGWISGLAVVSKTRSDSPPGPLCIECESSTREGWQNHRKSRWIKKRGHGKDRKNGNTNMISVNLFHVGLAVVS